MEPLLDHAELIFLLTLAAFVAGYVDAIAGGGGLITLPALMLAGLSPVEAIATNKLQGTAGAAASSYMFWKADLLDQRALRFAVPAAAIGSALGCLFVGMIDATALQRGIPALLIAVAIYFVCQRPQANTAPEADAARQLSPGRSAAVAGPVGFYDGFLGPGAGSFYMAGLTAFAGAALLPALSNTKVLNFTSNVAALLVFLTAGSIVFWAGLPMAAAQFAGSRLGAMTAIRHGTILIRPMIVTVSILLAVRLLLSS